MIDKLFDQAGYDGCKHIIVSALLTALLQLFLSTQLTILIVLFIGIAKELYDHESGKGCAEWKDIICDVIGIFIGI
jgi:hypothetical protein